MMLMKCTEKNLDGNNTRRLCAVLDKSWKKHLRKQQLYDHLPPILKTIQVRWTRDAKHNWRSKEELISDLLPWIPTHGYANVGQPARTNYTVWTLDVVWRIYQKRWTIGMDAERERESGKFEQSIQLDNEDYILDHSLTFFSSNYQIQSKIVDYDKMFWLQSDILMFWKIRHKVIC